MVWRSNFRIHIRLFLLGEEPHLLSCVPEFAVGPVICGALNSPLSDCRLLQEWPSRCLI
jgi:hypothetical protein